MKIQKIIIMLSLLFTSNVALSNVTFEWYSTALGNGLKINSTFTCLNDRTMLEHHIVTANAITSSFWASNADVQWQFRFHTLGGVEGNDLVSVNTSNFYNSSFQVRGDVMMEYKRSRQYEVLTHQSDRRLQSGSTYTVNNRTIDPACNVASTPVQVNGLVELGLSGLQGSEAHYVMNVPAGATNLTISIAGATGDADMYVRMGSQPTLASYDCRPYIGGSNEECNFAVPTPGTYHVMLKAYTAYSGVNLVGSYTP